MADRLGKTYQECQQGTTSTEFVRWCVYLRQESEKQDKLDYYLSRICTLLEQMIYNNAGEKRTAKAEDHLPKYKYQNEQEFQAGRKTKKQIASHRKMKAAVSKAAWLGFVQGNQGQKKLPDKKGSNRGVNPADGTRIPVRPNLREGGRVLRGVPKR